MKRFRYKGDLSKHIKRYHPGHTQALTPVPLQEDEIATMALTNKAPTAKSVTATVSSSPSIQIKASSIVSNVNTKSTATSIGTTDNKFFLPLLPKHPVQQSELPGFSKPKNDSNVNIIAPTISLVDNSATQSPMSNESVIDLLTHRNEGFPSANISTAGLIQTIGQANQKPRIQIQQPAASASNTNISKVSFVVTKPSQGLIAQTSRVGNQNTLIMRQPINSLAPPPTPQMTTTRTILSPTLIQTTSKLQEALLHGKPRTITNLGRGGERVTLVTAAGITNNGAQTTRFAVPTSTIVRPKPQNATLIQTPINIATSTASSNPGFSLTESNKIETPEKPKTLTISISEVFASAQPLPLQEEARQHNKGKMTTMADLEPQAASMGPLNAVLQQKGITIATPSITQQPDLGNSLYRQIVHQTSQPILPQKPSVLTTVALQQPQTATTKPTTVTPTKTENGVSKTATTTEPSSPKSAGASILKATPSAKKSFACDHAGCNKSFDKASLLKKHAKLHTKQYKFTCDVCHKGFESHSKKEDHYRKHTGVKPFLCELCGHSFRYKGKPFEFFTLIINHHEIGISSEDINQIITIHFHR